MERTDSIIGSGLTPFGGTISIVVTNSPAASLRPQFDLSASGRVSRPFGALLHVDFATLGVTGRACPWLPEPEAEVDLWVPVPALGNLHWFRAAVAAAIDHIARQHRVARYRTTVPTHLAAALQDLGFKDGAEPDPWLRKHLSQRNL